MVNLDSFLAPVVQRVAEMSQLLDASRQVIDTDPTILAWAKQVYGIAAAYCNRPFYEQTIIEKYSYVINSRIPLRLIPVTSITSVRLIGSDTDLDVSTYSLDGNDLVIETWDASNFINSAIEEGVYDKDYYDVRVTYVGGYTIIDEDDILIAAFANQIMQWWRQRDMQVAVPMSGGESRIYVTNLSKLSEDVKDMLAPFVYRGVGYKE